MVNDIVGSQDFDMHGVLKKSNYFGKNKHMISKVINRHYGISSVPENFYLVNYLDDQVVTNKKANEFYISDISSNLINFHTSIYHSKTQKTIEFPINNDRFIKLLPNIIEFFDTFYANTQIFYMGNFSTNRKLNSLVSKLIVPEANVFQSAFKIIGERPRNDQIKHFLSKKEFKTLNVLESKEDHFFQEFLFSYNDLIIPKDFGYTINFMDDKDVFKEYMDFLKMIMF